MRTGLAGRLFALGLLASIPNRMLAQCPDGSAPPCAPPRRPLPPMDARTWMVVPFANVTANRDADWLRFASANLLYLDLARWSDIRVIDDGRVADFVRALAPAERSSLSLDAGLALARRAGAGRLVMGDILTAGTKISVIAKVYDATNGARLRTVTEELPTPDSTMAVYARLAAAIVATPAPGAGNADAIGTRSLEAYRAYVAGLEALHAFQLDSAVARFERSISNDSTFALARHQLSVALGWIDPGAHGAREREQAAAAGRFSAGLPTRERMLIAGRQLFLSQNHQAACATYRGLLAADSLDAEAWYSLGECNYHNNRLDIRDADTANARFAGDWTLAHRAFNRALELRPEMHLSYRHLLDMLKSEYRYACLANPCNRALSALVEVRGDSLFTTPRYVIATAQDIPRDRLRAERPARLAAANATARRWVAVAPDQGTAHLEYALVLEAQGRFTQAAGAMATARRLGGLRPASADDAPFVHVRLLMHADSLGEAARTLPQAVALADSLLKGQALPPRRIARSPAEQTAMTYRMAGIAGLLGRFSAITDSTGARWEPRGYLRARAQLAAGVTPPNLAALLTQIRAADAPATIRAAAPRWFAMMCVGHCPPIDIRSDSAWQLTVFARIADGDTARARRILARSDSLLALAQPSASPLAPHAVFLNVLAHMQLSDTAAALRALTLFDHVRTWPAPTADIGGPGGAPTIWLLARAWMLHGDLLLATGARDAASLFYRRVVDLWSSGDAEVLPFVTRARQTLPGGRR